MSADWIIDAGLRWPEDVLTVGEEVLHCLLPAQIAPKRWSLSDYKSPPSGLSSRDMREIAASRLAGVGLEIGALASPFPVPLSCDVLYGDRYTYEEIREIYSGEPTDDLVIPTIMTDFSSLEGVGASSLDFIIASHVVEHTRDPIRAIVHSYRCLREGGTLLLVVPDKRRTFDRLRPETTLEHLVLDYFDPSLDRDMKHFEEFYSLAYTSEMPLPKTCKEAMSSGASIHYHVWEYNGFLNLVDYIRKNFAPFRSVWSHETLALEQHDFEFYIALTK
ncbi:class I SAM-dependent methyltransferase [Rhizobium rhododendri]|uniref:Methyltransferase domain-containing protein n=1 Tax=Rhizobium rhododendri TaxID=2506430 RepID=A0ABY8IPS5_9HYPH|nr:methyltransferase domain-containing protein [Rhizobium rhododendri]WFS25148.1 methyltransferase domain-containing protein [Rhizobium rhododendri]